MYPRKPKELADDLESFIYVPAYCAFRYHKHDLSSDHADAMKNATPEERARDNTKNTNLAHAKHNFFYHEQRHDNGLHSGGGTKHKQIELGKPPIELTAGGSPLNILLKKSFNLLHKHYRTVDEDHLKQHYSAVVPQLPRSPLQATGSGQATRFVDVFNILGMQQPADGQMLASSQTSSPSSSSAGSSASRSRPLDDHTQILNVFTSVWFDNQARQRDVIAYANDRLYDQFDSIRVVLSEEYSDPSNNSGKDPAGRNSTSKRKSDGSDEDINPRPKRRPKRQAKKTRTHGYQVEFDPSQEGAGEEDGDSEEDENGDENEDTEI